jgi:DNA polymerase III alpha subunit
MPDFDIDFCMDRRDEVIDYVARKYGRDRVSQIITYGTMAAKAVLRDVPAACSASRTASSTGWPSSSRCSPPTR